MRPLFKNADRQQEFNSKGYVLIPFLDRHQVTALLDYYETLNSTHTGDYGFHVSLDNPDKSVVGSVSEKIKTLTEPAVEKTFDQCKVFTSSYVIKEPGLNNIVPPHQDWSFTDETQFYSATVWIPLVDVTIENGALGVIDGSHHFFDHPRSSPSPQSQSPLTAHAFTLFPYAKVIEMKAGQALVFDNRTIHASPPNTSEQPRIAAGIGIVAAEAPLRHYYQLPNEPEEQLEVYDVTPEFFTTYDNAGLSSLFDAGEKPTGWLSLGPIKRTVPNLSKEEMEALVKSVPTNALQHDLVDRLQHLYPQHVPKTTPMKQESTPPPSQEPETTEAAEWKDPRSFFEMYTIPNIIAEIKWRLLGKK